MDTATLKAAGFSDAEIQKYTNEQKLLAAGFSPEEIAAPESKKQPRELTLGEAALAFGEKLPGQAIGAAWNVAKAIPGFAMDVVKPEFLRSDEEREQRAQQFGSALRSAKNIAVDVPLGVLQQARNLSPQELRGTAPAFDTSAAEAMENALYNRYGNWRNIKNTMATDPGGMTLDVASIVAPTLGPVSRIGNAGNIIARTGMAINPVTMPQKLASALVNAGKYINKKVVEPAVSHTLGFATGAEAPSIREAAKAGYGSVVGGQAGADAAEAFQQQLRTDFLHGASPRDALNLANDAIQKMRDAKTAAYKSGISKTISGQSHKLDFSPIDSAVRDAAKVSVYKGKVISEGAEKVWKAIENIVDDWRMADPAEFHTAEGLDALKRRIGSLSYEEGLAPLTKPGSPGATIVKKIYGAVKKQITDQYPEYAKVMKDFMDADDLIVDIEKTFSLGQKSQADTAIRKLQSIMRNNAASNQSARAALAQNLISAGADNLMPTLAGQSLSAALPRGLARIAPGVGGLGALSGFIDPSTLIGLGLTSPRLVGEGAYYAGKVVGTGKRAADATRATKLATLLRNNPNALNAITLAAGQATRPNYEEIKE